MKGIILWPAILFIFSMPNPRLEYVADKLALNGFSKIEAQIALLDPRLKPYPPQEVAVRPVDWKKYTEQLLTKESVLRGKQFLNKHRSVLEQIEKSFGIEKEVLVALIRIETNFGQFTGNYSVVNVFYTKLLNASSAKWRFQADNLAAALIYCKKERLNCFKVYGSYAGAFGLPQFLPVSILNYGYDGNGDKKVNLFEPEDALASAANFLYRHEWSKNKKAAMASYYGTANGYPEAAELYAEAIKR